MSGIAIINKTCGVGENRTRLLVLYVAVFEDRHMIDAWSRSWTSDGTGGACVENTRRSRIQVSENMCRPAGSLATKPSAGFVESYSGKP